MESKLLSIKNIKLVIIIIASLLLLFLIKDWIKPKLITALGGYTNQEITIVTDTIIGEVEIDTIKFIKKYIETYGETILKDTIIITKWVHPVTEEEVDSVKHFNVKISDSLIEGNFNIFNKTNGDLVFSKFNYYPKFPKYITKTYPKYITKTITKTLTNERSYFGVGLGINTELNPNVNINYLTKDKWNFGINVEKDFNISNVNNNAIIGLNIIKYF